MNALPDHTTMNRTAKYFMDNGRAETFDDAMTTLRGFGVSVIVGPEIEWSPAHQIALLTFVNAARRTFLGGVEVVGPLTGPLFVPLASARTVDGAVRLLGGQVVAQAANDWATI